VEVGVLIAERWILATLRNERFTSLRPTPPIAPNESRYMASVNAGQVVIKGSASELSASAEFVVGLAGSLIRSMTLCRCRALGRPRRADAEGVVAPGGYGDPRGETGGRGLALRVS
jgi:hypothetical protein